MKLAARVGDPTAHTPLSGSGSPNVFIGGRPAWRAIADFHSCPLYTGLSPHVGGSVVTGGSVLINNFPAATMGDTIIEAGPPNKILGGCPTVFIG